MKRLAILSSLIIFVIGLSCGGGGGGTSTSVTPPEANLEGTYRLTGFDLDVYDSNMVYVGRITQEDFSSWSGSMKLGANTINQTFVLEDYKVPVSGTYTVTYTNSTTEGIFHMVSQIGAYDISFTCAGNSLTTYSGVIYDPFFDEFVEEYDHWVKTSDSMSVSNTTTQDNFYSESENLMIGRTIGSIVE
jgi:hypothetical protein